MWSATSQEWNRLVAQHPLAFVPHAAHIRGILDERSSHQAPESRSQVGQLTKEPFPIFLASFLRGPHTRELQAGLNAAKRCFPGADRLSQGLMEFSVTAGDNLLANLAFRRFQTPKSYHKAFYALLHSVTLHSLPRLRHGRTPNPENECSGNVER